MLSIVSRTVAPTLRSSAAIAAMRSVSFTRQLAIPVIVIGASANSASTATVMAASGISMALNSPRLLSLPFGPSHSINSSPHVIFAPMRSSTFANCASP